MRKKTGPGFKTSSKDALNFYFFFDMRCCVLVFFLSTSDMVCMHFKGKHKQKRVNDEGAKRQHTNVL